MPKFKFKCKGELENGKPCDKYVSTKMHKGISKFAEIREATIKVKELESQDSDSVQTAKEALKVLKGIPEVPVDWEFTLKCLHGHENDYTYGEREK